MGGSKRVFVGIERSAHKSLRKISNSNKLKINARIEDIQQSETVQDIPHNGKLQGTKDRYKIRVGNYRIIYKIESQNEILITSIDHRKQSYKKLFEIILS